MAVRRLIGLGSAALAAAASAGLYAAFRKDMRQLSDDLAARAEVARTALGPIEYARRPGSGRQALVIHGAGGGFDQGLALGTDIFGPDADILAPSRFGYLGTPVPEDGSPAAQADAHAALLDALGIARTVVVGVSAGAPSAIELALRRPERVAALVLLVPRAFAPGAAEVGAPRESRGMLATVMSGIDFPYWLAIRFARRAVVRFLGVPPALEGQAGAEDRARVSAIMRSILPLSRRMAGLRNDSAACIGEWPLDRIAVPTLAISTADDGYRTLPGARYTVSRIPGAELVVLESGGHLLVGQSPRVRAVIDDFLARHDASPPVAA